uniref:CSON010617 protein n=1 Tax=Culicoides sonorensis TaxID=179676 RepID=A0A336M228_CULSO
MYSYNIFEDITNGNKRSNENLIRLSNKKLRTDEQILCIYDDDSGLGIAADLPDEVLFEVLNGNNEKENEEPSSIAVPEGPTLLNVAKSLIV